MLYDIYTSLKERGLLKWLVVGLALFVVIIIVSLVLQPRYERHALGQTPFTTFDGNFAYLEGDEVYTYNGAAFYKVKVTDTNEVTVLSSGLKLPVPSEVVWASDKGALMNFGESFALTEVERKQSSSLVGLDANERAYTWYLDFESGSLHKVAEKPLAPGAYFSPDDNGFYYMPDVFFTPPGQGGDDVPESTPINFFDIASRKNSTVINDPKLVDIRQINKCPDDRYRICLVARDEDDLTKLGVYAITDSGQRESLLTSDGRLFATNDPRLYVTTVATEYFPEEEEHDEDEEEETGEHTHGPGEYDVPVDFSPTPAVLRNLADSSAAELGFDIAGEMVIPYIVSADNFYVISGETADTYLSGTRSVFGQLTTKEFVLEFGDRTLFGDGFMELVDYGDNGVALLATSTGQRVVFAPRGSLPDEPFRTVSSEEAEEQVKGCLQDRAETYQYFDEDNQYKIFFKNNGSFRSNIKSFTDCLTAANPHILTGNNFYFGAVDPVNGRIVSD